MADPAAAQQDKASLHHYILARALRSVTPAGGRPVEADTATKAWAALYASDAQAAARAAGVSGAKMFGVSLPAVARAIERLPGAERCERYCGWPEGSQPPPPPELVSSPDARRARPECCGILPLGSWQL